MRRARTPTFPSHHHDPKTMAFHLCGATAWRVHRVTASLSGLSVPILEMLYFFSYLIH